MTNVVEQDAEDTPEEDDDVHLQVIDGDSASSRLPLRTRISGILFVATKPLAVEKIATYVRAKPELVEQELAALCEAYSDEEDGFSLCEAAEKWQFRSSPALASVVQRMIPPKARRLSRAAAETLAVIAYKQPVQRAEIEAIRGVDALPTVKTLLDAKLVRVVGHDDSPGRPALYGTTEAFLDKFGLRDLSELPSARELEQLAEEPGEGAEDVDCSVLSDDESDETQCSVEDSADSEQQIQ